MSAMPVSDGVNGSDAKFGKKGRYTELHRCCPGISATERKFSPGPEEGRIRGNIGAPSRLIA
jgi:hypothetical protein